LSLQESATAAGIPSNPQSTDSLDKIIDAFVDDTDLWDVLYGLELSDSQRAMSRMQQRASAIFLGATASCSPAAVSSISKSDSGIMCGGTGGQMTYRP